MQPPAEEDAVEKRHPELIIALFLAGVRSETLPVRIWNSLHLQVEPIIAAVSAFLIAVTGIILLLDALLRQWRQNRLLRTADAR